MCAWLVSGIQIQGKQYLHLLSVLGIWLCGCNHIVCDNIVRTEDKQYFIVV